MPLEPVQSISVGIAGLAGNTPISLDGLGHVELERDHGGAIAHLIVGGDQPRLYPRREILPRRFARGDETRREQEKEGDEKTHGQALAQEIAKRKPHAFMAS